MNLEKQAFQSKQRNLFASNGTTTSSMMGFRADIIAEDKVLVELKSIENLLEVHKKQTLTYLKLTNLTLGLLINFGSPLLKNGIHRIANNFKETNS